MTYYTVYIIPVVGVSGTCIPIIKTNSNFHNPKKDEWLLYELISFHILFQFTIWLHVLIKLASC